MVDIEKIMSLTTDEIKIASELYKFQKEAEEAERLIRETYHSFGIQEEKIEVGTSEYGKNTEYLTHSGIWQARYLNINCDIVCSEAEIFRVFAIEYFVKNKVLKCFEGINYTKEGDMARACKFFRAFIERTRNKYEEQKYQGKRVAT